MSWLDLSFVHGINNYSQLLFVQSIEEKRLLKSSPDLLFRFIVLSNNLWFEIALFIPLTKGLSTDRASWTLLYCLFLDLLRQIINVVIFVLI